MRIKFYLAWLILSPVLTYAQSDTLIKKENPINDDTYLHPMDGITPYTFKKGEWFYAQSLQTLPAPGWAFVGLTDKLTLQLDITPFIGGLFFKPHYPIPSVSLRYKIIDQKKLLPTFSVETQFFHLWDTLKRFDINEYSLYQKGSYFHFKTLYGYNFNPIYINFSVGFDYVNKMWWQQETIVSNNLTPNVNPNFSLTLSYRKSKWISYHIAASYGSTLTYFENAPRKIQLNYGFRIAPFYKNKWGILRNMRIELISINGWFKDIDQYSGIPVPIYPLFYWQWNKDYSKKRN
ncbi:MAG: hypothetical protein ACWA41_12080 [Putridiphycobacter sp.]